MYFTTTVTGQWPGYTSVILYSNNGAKNSKMFCLDFSDAYLKPLDDQPEKMHRKLCMMHNFLCIFGAMQIKDTFETPNRVRSLC